MISLKKSHSLQQLYDPKIIRTQVFTKTATFILNKLYTKVIYIK